MSPNSPASTGLLLILSAPSGAGKTTLARRLNQDEPHAYFSISHTTREPRGTEQDGVDYHFVDSTQFKERIEKGEFVEWAEVHGHFYGSPQASVDRALEDGELVIFDIDVQGGVAIKRKYPEAVLVFIAPPSVQELERRLRARGTDREETIQRRMLAARAEMERGIHAYDYVVLNDEFERAYGDLRAIVLAERCRTKRVDLRGLGVESIKPATGA
jgi:guanylate kinase